MTVQRASFDIYLNAVRLILTRVPQYIIPFWYSAEPMFWLPHGMFPYYAEWFLSLPKAPLGSVSIMSWQVACSALLSLVFEVIASIWGLIFAAKVQGSKSPGAVGGTPTKQKEDMKTSASTEKKDL
jgi:tail-anchored protein insertion receptor